MPGIILHHYAPSPVSEKVRVGLGIKRLAWRSVEIPRMPPKPELTPLTGGYRRTPVMQVGADIYCDTQCILREIDRRHPEPTFFPGGGYGMPWALSRWTDGELFTLAVSLIIPSSASDMPEDWVRDRGGLYFGKRFDLDALKADMPHKAAQLRAELGWLNERLAHGRDFILGEPGLPDALCYYIVWFVRGRWNGGADMLAEFPALEAWEERVKAIGHGTPEEMTPAEALETARAAEPETPERADARDPQGLRPGMAVTVVPEGDGGGDPEVAGTVHALGRDTLAILREDERAGTVCVHFPRVGYRVTPQ